MRKVSEILNDECSLFSTMETAYSELFTSLFGDTTAAELDLQLLVNCGERYAAPLLSKYEITDVVDYIVTRYGHSWSKVKNVLNAEYNALQPYNNTQTTESEKTAEQNDTTTNETAVFAFDSGTTATDTDTDTSTREATQTNTDTTTVTSSGNNGNVATQDLITKEIELRKNSFILLVINDTQAVITLDIY